MTRLNIRQIALAFAAVISTACGGSTEPIKVAVVTVTPATSTKAVGETVQLSATTADANGNALSGRAISWSSSNTSTATVSTTGLVTAVAQGAVIITATSQAISGSAAITITPPPVATLTLPATVSIVEHTPTQLTAIAKSANGTALTGRVITWTSSIVSVATVSATGVVTTLKRGSTVITATSEGKTATTMVTVIQSPGCLISNATPIVAGQTISGTLTTTDCAFGVKESDFDGTFFDIYKFVLPAATTVDIQLKSTAFDAYLFLYYGVRVDSAAFVADDDDSGGGPNGTDARITGNLTAPGTYYILANNADANGGGAYTLSLVSPFTSALRAGGTQPTSILFERVTGAPAMALKSLVLRRRPKRN
ncbi:MAG: Ig-like domain-containing protein [Gemmatimonadota bacterium]|nr:Ig-like domain-containing protein [Gemmatimonadota bacterium]